MSGGNSGSTSSGILSYLKQRKVETAVLVSGITSMGMEILAGRMIAPSFGSSIYTWGSIIGVFLAALSLGYFRGGKKADQASRSGISRIMLITALYFAAILLLHDAVLQFTSGLPLPANFAPLLPVTILFGYPVYILGFISPYSAELSDKQGKGQASGHIYAIGTAGSILGAFATTFLLIPLFSVETIGFIFGILLVFVAIWNNTASQKPLYITIGILLTIVLAVASFGSSFLNAAGPGDTLYRTQTPYQSLSISDNNGVRTMYLNGQPQSAMRLGQPFEHVFEYTPYFHMPLLMTSNVDRAYIVGGGGFTGPKIFNHLYNMTIDVAELDPDVIDAAKRYFQLEESETLRVHNRDGRQFLEGVDKTYDVIILDAYRKDTVPFHLTTKEFMQLAYRKLDSDGVLLSNLITRPSSSFYRSEYRTLDEVFPQVYSFHTREFGLQNILLVATKDTDRLSKEELLQRNEQRDIGIDLEEQIRTLQQPINVSDAQVLTDSKAPVDNMIAQRE